MQLPAHVRDLPVPDGPGARLRHAHGARLPRRGGLRGEAVEPLGEELVREVVAVLDAHDRVGAHDDGRRRERAADERHGRAVLRAGLRRPEQDHRELPDHVDAARARVEEAVPLLPVIRPALVGAGGPYVALGRAQHPLQVHGERRGREQRRRGDAGGCAHAEHGRRDREARERAVRSGSRVAHRKPFAGSGFTPGPHGTRAHVPRSTRTCVPRRRARALPSPPRAPSFAPCRTTNS